MEGIKTFKLGLHIVTTKSLSYFKKYAATIDLKEPMIITKNGVPLYIVQPYASYRPYRPKEGFSLARFLSARIPERAQKTSTSAEILKSRLVTILAEQSSLDGNRRNRIPQHG